LPSDTVIAGMTGADRCGARGGGLDPDGFAGWTAADGLGKGFLALGFGVGTAAGAGAGAGADAMMVADADATPDANGSPDVVAESPADVAGTALPDSVAAADLPLSCTSADLTVTAVAVTPCFSSKLIMALS
jgi:hypothetical protein